MATWQFRERRSWSCRLLFHRRCQSVWKVHAVAYDGPGAGDRREVKAFAACPCRCHGTKL